MNTPAAKIATMPHANRSKKEMPTAVWPRPEEVKAAREEAGLTQTQAASLVHTGWQTWAKWEAEATSDSARRMHPATWELFNVKLQIIKLLAKGTLSEADVRKMKVYLPPVPREI